MLYMWSLKHVYSHRVYFSFDGDFFISWDHKNPKVAPLCRTDTGQLISKVNMDNYTAKAIFWSKNADSLIILQEERLKVMNVPKTAVSCE